MIDIAMNLYKIYNVIVMLHYIAIFIGNISAKEFSLDSYKSWSLDLNLTSVEKNALLTLLGTISNTDSVDVHMPLSLYFV
jgi:cbb3-type cytochrome oxidase subunit 1